MGDIFQCPIDGTALALLQGEGHAETICHRCRRGYRIARGRVTTAKLEHPRRDDLRALTLGIEADGDRLEIVDAVRHEGLQTPGAGKRVTAVQQSDRKGERWRLLTLQRGDREALALREARDPAAIRVVGTVARGLLLTAFTVALLMTFYHWAWVFLSLLGIAATALVATLRWRAATTRRSVSPTLLATLEREQWLLGRLLHYEGELTAVSERLRKFGKQRDEVKSLAAEVGTAGPGYGSRREVLLRAADVYEQHIRNDEALRDAILQATKMVEIEYRAARLLDHLPDDTIDRLTQTMSDLDAMEEENRALEAKLEADAEVRMLTS